MIQIKSVYGGAAGIREKKLHPHSYLDYSTKKYTQSYIRLI